MSVRSVCFQVTWDPFFIFINMLRLGSELNLSISGWIKEKIFPILSFKFLWISLATPSAVNCHLLARISCRTIGKKSFRLRKKSLAQFFLLDNSPFITSTYRRILCLKTKLHDCLSSQACDQDIPMLKEAACDTVYKLSCAVSRKVGM